MQDKAPGNAQEKTRGSAPMKKHNPNEQHNSKKAALGPNTKR